MIAFGPPALPGYGNVAGFSFQLQDRSGGWVDNLAAQVQRFIVEASKRPEIGRLTTTHASARPDREILRPQPGRQHGAARYVVGHRAKASLRWLSLRRALSE